MSYETVIDQIKETPEQLLDEISYYIEFINYKNQKKSESKKHSAAERFFKAANMIHGNSNGKKWTRDELYDR